MFTLKDFLFWKIFLHILFLKADSLTHVTCWTCEGFYSQNFRFMLNKVRWCWCLCKFASKLWRSTHINRLERSQPRSERIRGNKLIISNYIVPGSNTWIVTWRSYKTPAIDHILLLKCFCSLFCTISNISWDEIHKKSNFWTQDLKCLKSLSLQSI